MIKTDNLDEYVSIKTLLNYCSSHATCDKCKIKPICDVCNGYNSFKILNIQYEPSASNSQQCINEEGIKPIDYLVIKEGKKEVLENALLYWKNVKVSYDEDNNIYKCEYFYDWVKNVVKKEKIPNEISFDEFRVYFRKELQEIYEKEKTKALNKAKGIENVEEE